MIKVNRDKPEVTWTIEMFSQIKMLTIWDFEDFEDALHRQLNCFHLL